MIFIQILNQLSIMKHYLFNNNCKLVREFETFDSELIKSEIVNYLTLNPTDGLTHEKDFSEDDRKIYAGHKVVDIYEVNPKNKKVSLCILKGNKTVYRSIVD